MKNQRFIMSPRFIMCWKNFKLGSPSLTHQILCCKQPRTVHHWVTKRALHSSRLTLYQIPITNQKDPPVTTKPMLTCQFHNDCESESDSDSEEVLASAIDFWSEPEKRGPTAFRELLHPGSEDPIIVRLNACETVVDVFQIIAALGDSMSVEQVSQAVLVLWDLQKFYYHAKSVDIAESDVGCSQSILKHYVSELNKNDEFLHLVRLVGRNANSLGPNPATCMLLYLRKMGVDMKHPAMQQILHRCEQLIEEFGVEVPLTALSRFAVAINSRKGIWPFFMWKTALPAVLNRVETCDNAEDFRLITICLNNIHQMIGTSTLTAYKKKIAELISENKLTSSDARVIVKAINFLNYPHWSHMNVDAIRNLVLVLKGQIHKMEVRDLVYLNKVFQSQLEPADMLDELQECARKMLSRAENGDDVAVDLITRCDLLSCIVSFSSPSQKNMFEDLAKRQIDLANFTKSMPALFMILRHLKTANIDLCNTFWSRTLKNLDQNLNSEREDFKLLRISHRYMHFNNNLGGTYRHYEFEREMKKWLTEEVQNGISGIVPQKFSRIAAFMIAYGPKRMHDFGSGNDCLEEITTRLSNMEQQFNVMDCLIISRGIQISMDLRNSRYMTPTFFHYVTSINNIMNSCARRQLESKQMSLTELNSIIRAYINRKGSRDADLFGILLERLATNKDHLSSRLIRDVVFNLHATGCLVPEIIDRMVEYIIETNEHMLGDTAVKLIYLCYTLGYIPQKAELFLPIAANLIIRDKERMSGLALLHAALSLCFFQMLPEAFIHMLFTVEFLERLDDEISRCYSKATYPIRMRHHLMQLNRAVCLDYPDADIPWFHKKYCEGVTAMEGAQKNAFHSDVLKSIVNLVGSRDLVQTDVYSPYSYKIDFQIILNEKSNPVHVRHQTDLKTSKIAILLIKGEDHCTNVANVKGQKQLQQRHLEMLGFRVITVSSKIWNSMYMMEPQAKENYLHDRIWPGISTVDRAVK